MDLKKILIVDDEAAFARMVKLNLEKLGEYDVRTESMGTAAVQVAQEFAPDLILLDVMMPDMDGCQVARELKESPTSRDIPVVFMTAVVAKSRSVKHKTKVQGYPCIAKPVTLKDLETCIKENLS
jgi:CheY-like chemotaxis protein